MASLPAWKLALLERKKKQEQEEKVKQAQAEQAKLASLPPWKRAILLREQQASTSAAAKSSPNTPSNKWQVAVERVKGPDSPIIKQKFSSTNTSNKWPERADSPIIKQKSQGNVASSNDGSSTAAKPVTRSQVGQRWQHAPVTSNAVPAISKPSASGSGNVTAEKSKNQVGQRREHVNASSISKPSEKLGTGLKSNGVEKSSPKVASQEEEDPNLSVLPAWKKALILKKRRQKQGIDEPDSGTAVVVGDTPVPVTTATSPPVPQQTKAVNAAAEVNTSSQRLIEQEGKTLHAPIYKEVDEWANVKEDDDRFKSLPLWKQALIKRRRADIAKRSGLPVTITPTAPLTSEDKASPLSKKKNKSANAGNLKKTTVESKKNVKSAQFDSSNKASKKKQNSTSRKIPISAKDEKKPARKAPPAPSAKKDKMFTYNFSKSTRHTLDTGGTSSDSTDSELEDAIITNLDESSDEGDSGIVLQRYAAKSNSSPSLGQKSHSESSVNNTPALSNPDKKKGKKHLRRVSWSDTNLVSEHFYLKYDYSDYDEIDQDSTNGTRVNTSNANSGLSHRLHPSLRPNDTSDPYAYGFNSASSPRSSTGDSSLSTFVPKVLSSYSPQVTANYNSDVAQHAQTNKNTTIEEVEEVDDFYSDIPSNTAALLW